MMNIDKIDQLAQDIELSDNILTYLKHSAVANVFATVSHPEHPDDEYEAGAKVFDWLVENDGKFSNIKDMRIRFQQFTGSTLCVWAQYEDCDPLVLTHQVMCEFDAGTNQASTILAINQLEKFN